VSEKKQADWSCWQTGAIIRACRCGTETWPPAPIRPPPSLHHPGSIANDTSTEHH
jgi:hypothetical protein